jgi:hypothetical protein
LAILGVFVTLFSANDKHCNRWKFDEENFRKSEINNEKVSSSINFTDCLRIGTSGGNRRESKIRSNGSMIINNDDAKSENRNDIPEK